VFVAFIKNYCGDVGKRCELETMANEKYVCERDK
jgi:predicted small metal-binding protein